MENKVKITIKDDYTHTIVEVYELFNTFGFSLTNAETIINNIQTLGESWFTIKEKHFDSIKLLLEERDYKFSFSYESEPVVDKTNNNIKLLYDVPGYSNLLNGDMKNIKSK